MAKVLKHTYSSIINSNPETLRQKSFYQHYKPIKAFFTVSKGLKRVFQEPPQT
ncbi:MAG: hypothetical protein FGF48_06305 [Candidatus Brockarchaeota archaeon]|nr:hypothetical protein [Candidatus Brockarchaeota archaeon]